jgi:hypothetical protein
MMANPTAQISRAAAGEACLRYVRHRRASLQRFAFVFNQAAGLAFHERGVVTIAPHKLVASKSNSSRRRPFLKYQPSK